MAENTLGNRGCYITLLIWGPISPAFLITGMVGAHLLRDLCYHLQGLTSSFSLGETKFPVARTGNSFLAFGLGTGNWWNSLNKTPYGAAGDGGNLASLFDLFE